ncbi:MAG: class I SAM-dependent methyltransferase [Endozoicomonas sp.]
MKGGIPYYAPESVIEGNGFRSNHFHELAEQEERSFWFRSRNRLILASIKQYCPDFSSFLEIGCGTGYVISAIAEQHPSARIFGGELFPEGLGFASSRVPQARFMQMDAAKIPFLDEFDLIGAFDVLEHIEEDSLVLIEIKKALTPGGLLLLTVPQHPWLWSSTDDLACHVRRYTRSDLHSKLEAAGFSILRSTSFVSLLLPALCISRLMNSLGHEQSAKPGAELNISSFLNRSLEICMNIEALFIRLGINLPIGGSRLIIAKHQ